MPIGPGTPVFLSTARHAATVLAESSVAATVSNPVPLTPTPSVVVASAARAPSVDPVAVSQATAYVSPFAFFLLGGPGTGEAAVSPDHPQAKAYSEF